METYVICNLSYVYRFYIFPCLVARAKMLHTVLNKRCKSGHLTSDISENSVCLSPFCLMFAVGLLYGIFLKS